MTEESKQLVEYVIKHDDGTVSYDIERFASVQDAEIAEFLAGDKTIESLDRILRKRLDPATFVSGKGKNKWDKYLKDCYEMYSQKTLRCYCEQLSDKLDKINVGGYASITLGDGFHTNLDIEVMKQMTGRLVII